MTPSQQQEFDFQDTIATLQTALSLVESSSSSFGPDTPPPSHQQLTIIAEGVKSASAKVGFMFSQQDTMSMDVAESLIKGVCDATTALCVLYATAAGRAPDASVTLKKVLVTTATRLVTSIIDLITTAATIIVSDNTNNANSDNSKNSIVQKAALCMEHCDAAAKVPLDGKTAIGKAMVRVTRQLNDAAKELEDDEENDKKLCTKASLLLQTVKGFVQAVMRVLMLQIKNNTSSGGDDDDDDDDIETWESILVNACKLSCSGDDLAVGIYEGSIDDVHSAVEQLMEWCNTIVVHVDDDDGGGSSVEAELKAVQNDGREFLNGLLVSESEGDGGDDGEEND